MENTNNNPMSVFTMLNSVPPSYHPQMPLFSPIVPIEHTNGVGLQQNIIDLPTQNESLEESAPKRRGRAPSKTKAKAKNSPKRQKSQLDAGPGDKNVCPICNQKLTKATYDEHMKMELAKIESSKDPLTSMDSLELLVPDTQQRTRRGAAVHARKKVQNLIQTQKNDDDEVISTSSSSPATEILKSVRNNRNKRASEKRNTTTNNTTTTTTTNESGIRCPICNATFDSDFDINLHIDTCLEPPPPVSANTRSSRKSRKPPVPAEIEEEEDSYDDGVETYTWADQTRVRTCSLLQEGYTGFDGEKIKKASEKDEEIELDIEEANDKYGNAQYSELDLITMEEDENKTLRERVIETEIHPEKPPDSPSHHYSNNVPLKEEEEEPQTENILIESLKAKIREQNKLLACSYKCLICLDQYQVPLVSVTCWHVHCEKCWLASLGAKKLCPQCKAITSPADLRKIFM